MDLGDVAQLRPGDHQQGAKDHAGDGAWRRAGEVERGGTLCVEDLPSWVIPAQRRAPDSSERLLSLFRQCKDGRIFAAASPEPYHVPFHAPRSSGALARRRAMKTVIASILLVTLPGGVTLSTQYKADRALRVEIDNNLKMQTTTMEMERDGQPVEGMGGGMSSETTNKEIHVDKVVEAKDGKPTKIHRSFEKVGGKSSRSMGENSNQSDIESPLDGVTLEIKRGADDKVEITTVEGKAPDAK